MYVHLCNAGCLVLALLQALASTGGGPATADSACQTSRTGQLEGLKGRLLQLEDAYMAKVRSSCCAAAVGYNVVPARKYGREQQQLYLAGNSLLRRV
jgi:hypothetical protein